MRIRKLLSSLFAVIALSAGAGSCGLESDYYYISEARLEGDALSLRFVFSCGKLDVTWDGTFAGQDPELAVLKVVHDDEGKNCGEDPRVVIFDLVPMKRALVANFPDRPQSLTVKIPPYDDTHGAICFTNVFASGSILGHRC